MKFWKSLWSENRSGFFMGILGVVLFVGTGASLIGRLIEEQPGFCSSCHEMKFFGLTHQSSGAGKDHPECISCHSGKGVVGAVSAEMTGVKELWVHFFGHPAPSRVYVSGVVPNENCVKCHLRGYNRQAHRNFPSTRFECAACHNHYQNQDFSGQIPASMEQYEREGIH